MTRWPSAGACRRRHRPEPRPVSYAIDPNRACRWRRRQVDNPVAGVGDRAAGGIGRSRGAGVTDRGQNWDLRVSISRVWARSCSKAGRSRMRARVQRTASARLLAMPAVMRVSSVATSSRLSLAITGVSSGPSGPGPQGPGPPRSSWILGPVIRLAGRLAAGHELEESPGPPACPVRAGARGRPRRTDGGTPRTPARRSGSSAGVVDDQPRDQLAGLDLGIVAVLEHLDPLIGASGKRSCTSGRTGRGCARTRPVP